jgi:hypothetical protein
MLAEAERAVSQASNSKGSDARVIGLNLFAAVITEFAPSTASAMQLPWDFHERCRVSLQNDFLQQFFQHAVGTARAAAETGRALEGLDGGVCVAALRLINAALAWDFQFTGSNPNGGGFGLSAAIPRGDVLTRERRRRRGRRQDRARRFVARRAARAGKHRLGVRAARPGGRARARYQRRRTRSRGARGGARRAADGFLAVRVGG